MSETEPQDKQPPAANARELLEAIFDAPFHQPVEVGSDTPSLTVRSLWLRDDHVFRRYCPACDRLTAWVLDVHPALRNNERLRATLIKSNTGTTPALPST